MRIWLPPVPNHVTESIEHRAFTVNRLSSEPAIQLCPSTHTQHSQTVTATVCHVKQRSCCQQPQRRATQGATTAQAAAVAPAAMVSAVIVHAVCTMRSVLSRPPQPPRPRTLVCLRISLACLPPPASCLLPAAGIGRNLLLVDISALMCSPMLCSIQSPLQAPRTLTPLWLLLHTFACLLQVLGALVCWLA
jgi:hypothetical protein